MTTQPPRSLRDLQAIKDPAERARGSRAYAKERRAAISTALSIGDAAIRELLTHYGPAEVARMCGVSLSTVKTARGRSQEEPCTTVPGT